LFKIILCQILSNFFEIKLCVLSFDFQDVRELLYGRWDLHHGLYLYIQFVMTSMWMDDSGERLPRDSRPFEADFIPRDPPDKSKQVLLPGALNKKNYYLSSEINFLVYSSLANHWYLFSLWRTVPVIDRELI